MSVRQVWKRKTSTLKPSPPSQNDSPPLPLRVYQQLPLPPSYNPLRDQMINQLHNISTILDSHTNPSNAYIHAPPSPPPPQIHPPSHVQVDFEKAFDNVNWEFLLDIMKQMGFGYKWRSWIKGCLSLASILVLMNEALQVLILEACGKGLFKGISMNNEETNLSLLQYADDALIFSEWSRKNIKNLISIFKSFHEISGLGVNLSKSSIYGIGVCLDEVKSIALSLNCKGDSLSFNYLGLPVNKDMSKASSWSGVVDRFTIRLSSWKFFWGFKEDEKRLIWIKWKRALASIDQGGLGIGSIYAKHKSGLMDELGTGLKYGVWENILSVGAVIDDIGIPFRNSFIRKIRCGNSISFWADRWVDTAPSPLKSKFPRLFALDCSNDCRLMEQGTFLRPGIEDSWSWALDHDGLFSVKHLSKLIDSAFLFDCFPGKTHEWNPLIPKKINIFRWRLVLGRILLLTKLDWRGVDVPSVLCQLCEAVTETSEHLFISFAKSVAVWRKCLSWWGISFPQTLGSISDMVTGSLANYLPPITKTIFNGVCYITLWAIWSWRNKVFHSTVEEKSKEQSSDIFLQIQSASLLWMSNRWRKRKVKINWNLWISSPYNIMCGDVLPAGD
ncbi:putative RNA-directed DNA polymerase [Tanacetum coccineum]|uniref:RNA-directed DNA polymerase n=1 Tax=Tanacetum coccineum TaxID=301880 RepID=A0ABQ5FDG4_9ASTR